MLPVGLHLRTFGDLEAEADEDVLEPLPRLGDHMGVAPPGLYIVSVRSSLSATNSAARSPAFSSPSRASTAEATAWVASLTA